MSHPLHEVLLNTTAQHQHSQFFAGTSVSLSTNVMWSRPNPDSLKVTMVLYKGRRNSTASILDYWLHNTVFKPQRRQATLAFSKTSQQIPQLTPDSYSMHI